MDEKKYLGLYWGSKALYGVEVKSATPDKVFKIPLQLAPSSGMLKSSRVATDNFQIGSLIRQALEANQITTSVVNLALSTQEIIFRTFVIPWMRPHEIMGVVSFEAIKYIPFDLETLSYSYVPMTFTENGQKKIRIVFVAIKKEVLDNYIHVLEQVGLQVHVAEPATISLIRLLTLKNYMKKQESSAILQLDNDRGTIIVLDQGIPQFVREFQLTTGVVSDNSKSDEVLLERIVGETKISLDYFSRQEQRLKIRDIKLLINQEASVNSISQAIQDSLSVNVTPILPSSIMQQKQLEEMDSVHAYGVGLVDSFKTNFQFNFISEKKIETMKSSDQDRGRVFKKKTVLVVALICLFELGLTIVFSQYPMRVINDKKAAIQLQTGVYGDSSIDSLKLKKDQLVTKVIDLKSVRLNSQASLILSLVPEMLPGGTWLKTLELNYTDASSGLSVSKMDRKSVDKNKLKLKAPAISIGKPVLVLTGYVYLADAKAQFSVVNLFVKNLKERKEIASLFNDIDLETVKLDKIDDFSVTFFKIKCQ